MNSNVYPLTIAGLTFLDENQAGESEIFTAQDADALRGWLETIFGEQYVSVSLSALESGFPVRFKDGFVLVPYSPRYVQIGYAEVLS